MRAGHMSAEFTRIAREIRPRGGCHRPGVWPADKELTLSEVTWRSHPVHQIYEVSTDGRVRSITRTSININGVEKVIRGRELKQAIARGYPFVGIYSDGHRLNGYVHRLVCETFHGPRPSPEHEVRHLNGVRTDNRLENLVWGTRSENRQDCLRHGTHWQIRKTHCPRGHEYTEANTVLVNKGRGRWCRQCRTDYQREWYWRHREQMLEKGRQSYAENSEEHLARNREHYYANRERILERQRAYYQANREKILARQKKSTQTRLQEAS